MNKRNQGKQNQKIKREFKIIRSLILFILMGLFVALLVPQPARAQLDVVHYIPPFYATYTSGLAARLYLSTPSTTAVNVSVDDGSGANIWSGTITNASPTWVSVTANVLTADSQLNHRAFAQKNEQMPE